MFNGSCLFSAAMMLLTALFCGLLISVHTFHIQVSEETSEEYKKCPILDDDFSVSALIEKANANIGKNPDDPLLLFGDIAVPIGQNASPCTATYCKWPKSSDGNVYVPYRISNQYSERERGIIKAGLRSLEGVTCIRFTPVQNQRDFVTIESRSGCYANVGRIGGEQVVSLQRNGCVSKGTVQHEFLHVLGFHHEQARSDRDDHVKILLQNVKPGMEGNFNKVNTRNLGTPYDYNSVMHYNRCAFSKNGEPTIKAIPDPNVSFGTATHMSPNDILRVNLLYQCNVTTPVQKFHVPSDWFQEV